MTDIQTLEDIKNLVDSFYTKVREDDLIGPIFNKQVGDQWSVHLNKMYGFWQTVLLHEHTYTGSPFPPHAKLPISEEHFDRWLSLFKSTLESNFSGAKADEALVRAEKMAQMFQIKIQYFNHNNNPSR